MAAAGLAGVSRAACFPPGDPPKARLVTCPRPADLARRIMYQRQRIRTDQTDCPALPRRGDAFAE